MFLSRKDFILRIFLIRKQKSKVKMKNKRNRSFLSTLFVYLFIKESNQERMPKKPQQRFYFKDDIMQKEKDII